MCEINIKECENNVLLLLLFACSLLSVIFKIKVKCKPFTRDIGRTRYLTLFLSFQNTFIKNIPIKTRSSAIRRQPQGLFKIEF